MWKYCDQSAGFIFGDAQGDPVADKVLQGLRSSASGLTRTQIRDLLNRNEDKTRVDEALGLLEQRRLAKQTFQTRGKKDVEVWYAR